MQFPDNYFDDEVRDGFLVPGIIKKSWAAQLEVLSDIDTLCRKHGIRWFADCGTLLGAVRHGGFVPWDDDLDICMLRDDYNRFIEIAPDELPEGYHVINIYTSDEFGEMTTRVTNTMAVDYRREHDAKYHEFPYPAGIDIFVLDHVSKDEDAEEFRKSVTSIVVQLAEGLEESDPNESEMQAAIAYVEELCHVKFDRDGSIIQQARQLIDKMYALYNKDDADEVALMAYWIGNDNHKYKLEYFNDTVKLPFENTYINAPAMYEGVLRTEYGNYMKLVRVGGLHDYPYFLKYEEEVEKAFKGKLPYRYYFSKEDMCARTTNTNSVRLMAKKQVSDIINSMLGIHAGINKLLLSGNIQAVLELLGNCQDVAISMGNFIEQVYGENFVMIQILEEYCEDIFKVHQYLLQDADINVDDAYTYLMCTLDKVDKAAEKYIVNRKEVVFLPYKASMWDSFDGLWRECMEDENCDVYVIPIPYYYKNARFEVVSECYEENDFPDDVPIMDYRKYNFESRHPDEIYIQFPYDMHNFVIGIHPYFYSQNIRQYTDKLTFVQPFVIDEVNDDDEKAVKNIREYICNKALINADRIITQSETMRERYIDILTDFAGEDTRTIWENKVDGSGFPLAEVSADAKKHRILSHFPDNWKLMLSDNNGQEKKIILYNNSISAILQNREQFIGKLKSVLQIFKENSGSILLLWRHNPLIRPTLEKTYPDIWAEYSRVIEQYKNEGWGIYDDVTSAMDSAAISDAYYGDVDSIVQKFRRKRTPVMIEDISVVY